jgi:hypothetical protein
MTTVKIANADKTFVEYTPAATILHVVTRLPATPERAGYCPKAKGALMRDLEARMFAQGFSGYHIHWSDHQTPPSG